MAETNSNVRSARWVVPDTVLVQRNTGPKEGPSLPEWVMPQPKYERGYGYMFSRQIKQADKGCDFDFLKTEVASAVCEPKIN